MEKTDEQLILEILDGGEESVKELFSRYIKPIYSFVSRYMDGVEAEDAAQEVFVKAWRNLKRFDGKRKFSTWIFAIAKNTAIDWMRKKKSVVFSGFENEDGENILENTTEDPAPLPLEILEKKEVATELLAAIGTLGKKYQAVLYLHYNDHFTFQEIAEIIGEPLDTVKSRHRRALISLRKLLVK
jgi:RNA polymerase sigma-70 factor (ECF subfamily)